MKNRSTIQLPQSALNQTITCQGCKKKLCGEVCEIHLRRDFDGTALRLVYMIQCERCGLLSEVIDKTREFTGDVPWWEQIQIWHEAALQDGPPAKRISVIPVAAHMIFDPLPLRSLKIYWGYKGDVGPIMLFGHGSVFPRSYGGIRLERDDQIEIFDGPTEDNLPFEKWWLYLKKIREGGTFGYASRKWTRLHASEIGEIVRDRVFEVVTTPGSKVRRKHEGAKPASGSQSDRGSPRDSEPLDSGP